MTGLSLRGVGVKLGGRPVLEAVSLDVAAGEYHVLLGPSGSGKTTLLRAVAGLEDVSAGEIWLDGGRVSAPGSAVAPEKRGVGMQFQSLALWPQWNATQQLEKVLTAGGVARADRKRKARELLELVGLGALTQRAVFELSGGEAQRLALARALASNPKVLLLDEPLGAVDASLRGDLAIELRQLQRRLRIPLLHVTHDQAEGLGVADRVTVLREGRIEHSGTVESVVKTPSTEFTARFVGKHAVIDGEAHGGRVKTPLGEFPCGAGHAGPVRAAFRPSQVRIGSGALDATVLHATYEPGGWLHRLEAAGTVLHAVSEALHPAGSRVTLELRGEPWLFPVKS